jgi:subtilisin-like proprotein convertase family protein
MTKINALLFLLCIYGMTLHAQTCNTATSTNVPVAIPTSGPPNVVTSTVDIVGLGGVISDVNVTNLQGTHTWIADLTITLTSPSGTTVTLVDGPCGNFDDFDIKFDDASPNAHTSIPCPLTDGLTYQPDGTLADFNGENPDGTWTLTISDGATGDGGSLNDWTIEVCAVPPPSCANPSGLNANNVTSSSADISWTAGGGSSTEVVILAGGSPAPTGGNTLDATTSNPTSFTGLTASTPYDVYLRDVCTSSSPLIISAVYDGPLTGGTPKGVELFVLEDINDLSQFGLGSANNGGGSDGEEFTFPAVAATAGTYIYVSNEATEFTNYFGFAPDYTDGSMSINGDDAIELFYAGTAVDVFGDINVDGTGQPWEYADGWAYRNTGQFSNGGTFNAANWTFSGVNAIALCTDNATCASVIPVGTFTATVDASVWVGPISFNTSCPTLSLPWSEGFNNGGSIPACWSMGGGENWLFNTTGPNHVGNNGVLTGSTTTNGYYAVVDASGTDAPATLTSPFVDISSLTTPQLSFFQISDNEGNANSQLDVEVWDGAAWNLIATYNTNTTGWQKRELPLAALTFTGPAQVRFTFSEVIDPTDFYDDIAIDDVTFEEVPSCGTPQTLGASNITTTSADINWTSVNGAQLGWEVSVVPSGSSPIAGTAGTAPFNATGLMAATTYDVYVREICAVGDTSAWAGPVAFTTACPAVLNGDDQSTAIPIAIPSTTTATTAVCFTDAYDGGTFGNTAPDTWYEVTAGSCVGSLTASLCGSAYDTRLYILDATGAQIGYNDDDCGLQSEIILDYAVAGVSPGDILYIVVDGFSSNSGSYTLDISEAPATPGTAAVAVDADASCNGSADGGLTASISGGAAAASYIWDNAATTASLTGLAAGTYNVTITDVLGCTVTASGTVNEPTALAITAANTTDVNCNGGTDGAIDITVAGGTAPYTFLWSNGATTEDLTGIAAGSYTGTITDANGCTAVGGPLTINEPTAIAPTVDAVVDASCNGGMDGSISISVAGGTAPYTFSWSNSATTEDLTALMAGNYTGTITDANGCSVVAGPITVGEPTAIAPTVDAVVDASCNGGMDGSISISVAGGTAPYTFSWSNSATTEDLTALMAGNYTGTITDANGCSVVAGPITVGEPTAIAPTVDAVVDASCNGGMDGSISISVAGGTAPYTFSWSNSATTEDLTALMAGNYTGTITDANGCSVVAGPITVGEPTAIAPTVDAVTDANCGASDGAINISVSGGTAPYTFLWSNGATTEDLTGIAAGSYTGTITDANGCSVVAGPIAVGNITTLAGTITATDPLCNGAATGAIDLNVTGGTAPYTFAWSNSATTEDLTGLIAGAYSVTITDANSCVITESTTIQEPTAIAIAVDATTDVSCNGDADGSIDISVSGGTGAYTFSWSNSATTEDLTGLTVGSYTGTITDANGCTAVGGPIAINEPTAIAIAVDATTDVSCNGDADGSIDISVSGGTGAYTFSWSNSSTTEDLTALAAGAYTGTITDANGCEAVGGPITINEPTALTLVVTDNGNGTATAATTGGTAPYSYNWSTGSTDSTATGTGTLSVTVTDANGCTALDSVTIVVGVENIALENSISLFPNPTVDQTTISFDLNEASDVELQLFTVTGQMIETRLLNNIMNESIELDVKDLPSGMYLVRMMIADEQVTKKLIISRP